MINFDSITKENTYIHNLNQPQILDHSYKILLKQYKIICKPS